MAAKFTRPTHKITIQLHLVARKLYHLQFSLQVASPETSGYTLVDNESYRKGYLFVVVPFTVRPVTCFDSELTSQTMDPYKHFDGVYSFLTVIKVYYIGAYSSVR
jgi:hypothetical protein